MAELKRHMDVLERVLDRAFQPPLPKEWAQRITSKIAETTAR